MRTPSWAHCLELVVSELAGPPDEADGPIPRLLSAIWRRSARPPVPGRPCEVLIMLEEAEPVGDAARVTVRLLHGETGVWRMVGHWPSLGERWPLVIAPTVRLLMSAQGHHFTHSVPWSR
ncbi:hypothetical protein BJ969_003536 [Saccharopolyspora gloriosae]|uniref:Uncharacterized protein n=1 Tax=Saccharopolyspora gloriosae TaxID=455344 RepID=A0A840NJH0_9PSEU|nr:hypothetical protein [Saccharopolyspora gloriosae]MBB5070448.1 hypothetical protein [Saccharopolyspora gloriosae]